MNVSRATAPPCETAHSPTLDQPEQPVATHRVRWRELGTERIFDDAVLCDPCTNALAKTYARQSKPLIRTGEPNR